MRERPDTLRGCASRGRTARAEAGSAPLPERERNNVPR